VNRGASAGTAKAPSAGTIRMKRRRVCIMRKRYERRRRIATEEEVR